MHLECMQLHQARRSKNKQKSFANPLKDLLRSLTQGVMSPLPGVYFFLSLFFRLYVHEKFVPPPCLLALGLSIPGLHVFIS